MRKLNISLWLLCLCTAMPLCMNISDIHATTTRTRIAVGKSFVNDTIIKPSGLTGSIDKLTMYGVVRKLSPNFSVRVVLKTTTGQEYLLMELYDALCSTQSRTFSNYAEETELLNHVTPDSLKIYVRNARLTLTSLYKTVMTGNDYPSAEDPVSLLRRRTQIKVDTINAINQRTNKLWRAGVTELSLQDDVTKRRVLGLANGEASQGWEYYAGGIFEVGEYSESQGEVEEYPEAIEMVDSFDWRNRHGRNWLTPVKDQSPTNFCVAFATVGCVEAMVNLYYNDTINLDLSEQEAACCTPVPADSVYHHGFFDEYLPLALIKNHGICDEESYPFEPNNDSPICKSEETIPIETISLHDYHSVAILESNIKRQLIRRGPLFCGVISHALMMCGYRKLQAGDKIYYYHDSYYKDSIVISENDNRIGLTCWIFKDSYDDIQYRYVIFKDIRADLKFAYYIEAPIYSSNRTEADRIWEDRDNDGYYNWGIGSKPAHCPSWVPDEPDGDDSNPLLGKMKVNGSLDSLNVNPNILDTIYISIDSISMHPEHFYNHVVLCNGATWDIQDNVTFHNGAKLIVRENAQLNVKANGVLRGANVISKSSSQVKLENGGQIIRPTNGEFKVELGSTFELDEGSVQ